MSTDLQHKWGIYGQDPLLKSIENELKADRLPHAMLLSGPDRIGKFSIFRNLAAILQCENGYCRECKICREIFEGRSLDTFILEDDGSSIKIEQIRDIRHNMSLSRQGNFKIVVIQNIERMSIPAANAFLKILEEPPKFVKFLLTTNSLDSVLKTIISRCRVYKAKLSSDEFVRDAVSIVNPDLEDFYLDRAAAFSSGRIGKALELVENSDLLEKYNAWYQELDKFDREADAFSLLSFAEELSTLDKEMVNHFFWLFANFVRYQLLNGKSDHYADVAPIFQEIYNNVSRNVNLRLSFEVLFLRTFGNFSTV